MADTHPLDSPGRRLAVVIPTLNDDAALARLLPILAHLELPPEHVIVVDGASSEATAAL
ncbi:MAG: glycosyltransferase, partial [Gammaproteobacteria bacterium]